MAEKGGNSAKGADFGRGTKSLPGKDYTSIQEGQAPNTPSESGQPKIVDKTS